MKNKSIKQQVRDNKVAKIKSMLPKVCEICGVYCEGDAAHLLPKSVYPEHYTNPKNIVRLCRDCHNKYDNDLKFRQQQDKLFNRICEYDKLGAIRYFKKYEC